MFTIRPITKAQVEQLNDELNAHASKVTVVSDNNDRVVGHGVEATAVFDPSQAGSLSFTVQHKPFYVSESAIEPGIHNSLEGVTAPMVSTSAPSRACRNSKGPKIRGANEVSIGLPFEDQNCSP
jgi:hypothetical protein